MHIDARAKINSLFHWKSSRRDFANVYFCRKYVLPIPEGGLHMPIAVSLGHLPCVGQRQVRGHYMCSFQIKALRPTHGPTRLALLLPCGYYSPVSPRPEGKVMEWRLL